MGKTIGRCIKEHREAAGLTQQQLANAAGLSLSNLAQIEQDEEANPRASTILAIAHALGKSPYDLIWQVTDAVADCYRLTPNSEGTFDPEKVSPDQMPKREPDEIREADGHVARAWLQAAALAMSAIGGGATSVVARVGGGEVWIWEETTAKPEKRRKA
jgi:transcriptional regulator with XRE-family HTH domain